MNLPLEGPKKKSCILKYVSTYLFIYVSRVNVKLPTVEVRYKNLSVEAECEVVSGKPLPTLWNSFVSMLLVSMI